MVIVIVIICIVLIALVAVIGSICGEVEELQNEMKWHHMEVESHRKVISELLIHLNLEYKEQPEFRLVKKAKAKK